LACCVEPFNRCLCNLFAASNLADAAMKSMTTLITLTAEMQNEQLKLRAIFEALYVAWASAEVQAAPGKGGTE